MTPYGGEWAVTLSFVEGWRGSLRTHGSTYLPFGRLLTVTIRPRLLQFDLKVFKKM